MAEKPAESAETIVKRDKGKERKFKVDRVWFIDKGIELGIFVFGLLIALYIDDVRESGNVKKLKEHYLFIVSTDLQKDKGQYERVYEHDSLRAEGCQFILSYLQRRQNADYHSFGKLKHDTKGRIGPGFDFEDKNEFNAFDTILIINERKGWYLDTSGAWINAQIVSIIDNSFNWFSQEVDDSVKRKIEYYEPYLDDTRSVFQHTTGYNGLMAQNTSAFMNTTEIESQLSDYYSFGSYLNWIEDFYRVSHYPDYNELRFSFGDVSFFDFLYRLNNEQNSELIRQLTIAKIQAQKEMGYYRKAIKMNKDVQQLIRRRKF